MHKDGKHVVLDTPTSTERSRRRQRSGASMARVSTRMGNVDALHAEHFVDSFPPHFHETFAIGVVESGAACIRTRRGAFTATAGSILAFAPGEVHAAFPVGEGGYSYRMLYPPASFGAAGINTNADGDLWSFRSPVIEDGALRRQLVHVHEPFMEAGSGEGEREELSDLLRHLVHRHADMGSCHRLADRHLAERACAYLRDHMAERVLLSVVADACGLTVFHLIRVFRRAVGVTPHAYLVQLRVNHAQRLLGEGMRVSDVAYSCGFSDQSHLTRIFRRSVGVPPGQYLRQVMAAPRN
jgi:AraC-like DNA-binding protein